MDAIAELPRLPIPGAHDSSRDRQRPLVIGTPRSGFSLLIALINSILDLSKTGRRLSRRDFALKAVVEVASRYTTGKYRQAFDRFGLASDLVFNGEFHRLVGGPKWLDKTDPRRACFRKYFGIRGQGDFLLVTSHPREVMEFYSVVHSHKIGRASCRERV